MRCEKFCSGPVNTNRGLGAKDLSYIFGEALLRGKIRNTEHHYCPVGCSNNPLTEEAAVNLIKNGGRQTMCLNNPWRYKQV